MIEPPRHLLSRLAARLRLWKPARLVEEARRAIEEGDHARAAELLAEATRRAPAWAEPLYLSSRIAHSENETRDEEEGLLLAALERDPEHVESERALLAIRAWRFEPLTRAWHLFHGGRLEEALAAFRATLQQTGTRLPIDCTAGVIAGIGWCHHGLARPDLGVEAFAEALAIDPAIAHAQKGMGICLYQLREFVRAEVALVEALRLEPKMHDTTAFLGWCAYATGRFDEAKLRFEEAREGNPLLADACWGVAWSRWKLGEVEGTKTAFLEALELGPGHPSRPNLEAVVLTDSRYEELRAAYLASENSRNEAPIPPRASLAPPEPLVEALAALIDDRPADCLAILDELPPGDRWREQWLRGRAHLRLENPKRALNAFEEAGRLAPGRVEPALGSARALTLLERKTETNE
jgi:tetratricopeptide (TPR) repeat protein